MRQSEITTQTLIRRSILDGATWTLGEAFKNLKENDLANLVPRDKDRFESWVSEGITKGIRSIECNETLTIGSVIALWYVGRCNEANAAWMASDDMTWQAYRAKLSGAKRQIVSRY